VRPRDHMVELDPNVGTLANLATALTLVVALAFGIVQVREGRQKRREMATLEALRPITSADAARMWVHYRRLPATFDYSDAQFMASDAGLALTYFSLVFEDLGLLVKERVIDIGLVELAVGDAVTQFWAKVQPQATAARERLQRPDILEWTQWLAEKLSERRAGQARTPAYEAFRGWRE